MTRWAPTPVTPNALLRRLVTWLRWGALGVSVMVALLGRREVGAPTLVIVGLVLALVAYARHAEWGADRLEHRGVLGLELAAVTVGVLLTGGWASPFLFLLSVPVLSLAITYDAMVASALALGLLGLLALHEAGDGGAFDPREPTEALLVLAAGLGIGLFARRVVVQAGEQHEETLGRIQQLGHVNAMLSTLHDLVRSMPAPLSVDEIVRVIRAQLDQLFDADAVVLLMSDGPRSRWRPVYAEGIRVAGEVSATDLPLALRRGGPGQRPVIVRDMELGSGLWDQARSGAYLWLWSRGQPIGLLALEHREPDHVDASQSDDLERLGVPLALAIDNAVWFQRLRTLGAEEERQRIGAELHDRFAQSLAYVAMELDRTVRSHPDDAELGRLREEVRATLADLRETLRELRLNVTEDHDLVEVLGDHVERFGERYGLVTEFVRLGDEIRPALPVEQQLLRIAQDLLGMAQREMAATSIRLQYETRPGRVHLRFEDDGRGTPEADLGAEAAGTLRVVRERADAVGATVDVGSRPGVGSTVQVSIRGLL